jgi:hypothetical protein
MEQIDMIMKPVFTENVSSENPFPVETWKPKYGPSDVKCTAEMRPVEFDEKTPASIVSCSQNPLLCRLLSQRYPKSNGSNQQIGRRQKGGDDHLPVGEEGRLMRFS